MKRTSRSENENAQFQASLKASWKKLGQWIEKREPAIPPPLNPKDAVKGWWWAKSEEAFQQFKTDSYAHGYELLRRLPKYRLQSFFHGHPDENWQQLRREHIELFRSLYRPDLARMGIVKTIFFSPKGIDFDCRLPATHLIEALKEELRSPAPFITGTYGGALVPKAVDVDERTAKAYTKQLKIWEIAFAPKPYMIHLPLPKLALNGDQYLNYFRNFVKDNTPADFAKHRAKCREESPGETSKRRPFNALANLGLALMAIDCDDTPKLSRWLLKQGTALKNLGISDNAEKLTKRLHNGLKTFQKLCI